MSQVKFIAFSGFLILNYNIAVAQTSLNWARASQGSGDSQIFVSKILTDSAGNVYTFGQFSGSILLDPLNQTGLINSGDDYNYDIYFCKSDSSGNVLLSFTLAGNTNDTPVDFAFDKDGNLWLGGYFYGVLDIDPESGEYLLTSAGETDLFLAKYNPEGELLWAGQFGSLWHDNGGRIAIDNSGKIHFGGRFNTIIDLDPGPDVYEIETSGVYDSDGFICTLDSEGNFIKAGQFEGAGGVFISEMKIDAEGNLWCGGSFNETVDFDPGEGVFMLGSPGYSNCFLVKLDPEGNFITALSYGGGEVISLDNLVFNSQGSLVITGNYRNSADFDPGPDEYILNALGSADCYILSLDKDGAFNWAASVGGESNESGNDIAVDIDDNVYVTGYFYGLIDADPGEGTYYLQTDFHANGFLLKLSEEGNFIWAKQLYSDSGNSGTCLLVTDDGSILESGFFYDMADFDPGEQLYVLWGSGFNEIFIRKLFNDLTIGINEVAQPNTLQVYPNPNNGFFIVEINTPSVCRVFSADGRLLFQADLNAGKNQLNMVTLKSGLYTIQTISSDEILVKKMLIQ